jgi:FkbM family methyltransferase
MAHRPIRVLDRIISALIAKLTPLVGAELGPVLGAELGKFNENINLEMNRRLDDALKKLEIRTEYLSGKMRDSVEELGKQHLSNELQAFTQAIVRQSLNNYMSAILPGGHRYMVELDDGMRFWLISGDEYVSPAIATGVYEPLETAFLKRQVKTGMAVLDIGANLGWFTVHSANLVGPQGRIDAFEPRADLVHLLIKTTAENALTNVTVHSFALGSQDAQGRVIWSSHDINPGGSHVVLSEPDCPRNKITARCDKDRRFMHFALRALHETGCRGIGTFGSRRRKARAFY